jgi:acyl carrier protein
MTRDEIRATLLRQLGEIAPEAELGDLDGAADLRDELDLDSMDFLSFVTAVDRVLHVAIPESDYARVVTLAGCTDYLAEKLGAE